MLNRQWTFINVIIYNYYDCSKDLVELVNKRIVLFSYGSGLSSTMYSIKVSMDSRPDFTLSALVANISDIPSRLASRKVVSPAKFEEIMKLREETHHKAPYIPESNIADLYPATFYLASVDDKHRRSYNQVPCEGTSAASAQVPNGIH